MTKTPLLRALLVVSMVFCVAADQALARGPGGGGRAGGRAGAGFAGRGGSARPGGSQAFAPRGARPGTMANGPATARDRSPAGVQQFLSGNAPGPGNRSGSFHPTQAAARQGQHAAQAQTALHNYQSGPPAFSPAWYTQHPAAWQHTHPHADAVAVASATAVTAWLAQGTYPYPATGSSTTVIYESSSPGPATATTAEPVSPSALPPAPGAAPEWLALGVYELKPTADSPAAQVVQLSVNRQGVVKGVYLDHLTSASQNVTGSIDQAAQNVQWSLDANPAATFSTSLNDLTQPQGGVTVALPGGTQTWVLQRVGDS